MIQHYTFIEGNEDGEKERVLSATIQPYNKLSAEETNNFKDKLNETVDAVNFLSPPLFGVYTLKFKGNGNPNVLAFEAGDIASRYTADGITQNALFIGGDPSNPANFTPLNLEFEPKMFITTGSSNEFELPAGMVAKNLFIDRGLKYKNTAEYVGEWDQSGTTVEVLGTTLATGRKVYITT